MIVMIDKDEVMRIPEWLIRASAKKPRALWYYLAFAFMNEDLKISSPSLVDIAREFYAQRKNVQNSRLACRDLGLFEYNRGTHTTKLVTKKLTKVEQSEQIEIPTWVLDVTALSHAAFWYYAASTFLQKIKKVQMPSPWIMVREMKCSKISASTMMNACEELRLITVTRRKKGYNKKTGKVQLEIKNIKVETKER